jgi:hypothetical protein
MLGTMGSLTRAKIDEYYRQFKSVNVQLTKEVVGITGLLVKMVNLKCGSDFFPCIIHSTSFETAKIIANNKSGITEKLEAYNNTASLRFCFKLPTTGEQVAFLIPSRITGKDPYEGSGDMSTWTLQYSQRPPDDLIEIIGRILDANYSYVKRKHERFPMNADFLRKMRLAGDVMLTVDGGANRCILRELGFGGARIVMKGSSEAMLNKPCSIKFEFHEPSEVYSINGKFVKAELIEGRTDMAILDMDFDDAVPMTYKTRICSYVSALRVVPAKGTPNEGAAP